MVIYEVNLDIKNEIYDEYMSWLKTHIKEMLTFKGFKEAKISYLDETSESSKKVTVWYTLNSKQDLNNYLTAQAPAMRQDGIARFGNKFSAYRRVFDKTEFLAL